MPEFPGGIIIICSRGGKPPLCRYCNEFSSKLCDFRQPSGRTCNAPICERHAEPVGKDLDYCKAHERTTAL